LETVAKKGGTSTGSDDIIQQHTLLEKMGWRLLDLDYASPPIAADLKKRKAVLLTVFITPRIPKYIHSERFGYCYYYLPITVVKRFVKEYWKGRCRRIGYDYSQDLDYRRMMSMIQRRQRLFLSHYILLCLFLEMTLKLGYRYSSCRGREMEHCWI